MSLLYTENTKVHKDSEMYTNLLRNQKETFKRLKKARPLGHKLDR